MLFRDRQDAGRQLAALLRRRALDHPSSSPLVLALPRGGVPVAREVAQALSAPLDVLVVRKLGAPQQREMGVGALAEGGSAYVDAEAVRLLGITGEELGEVAASEAKELQRRARLYRGDRPPPELHGRTVVLVDDGVATGGSARAAIRAVRERGALRVILAVPVIAASTAAELAPLVDELVYVRAPERFVAVGVWYQLFPQTTDDEVLALLAAPPPARGPVDADGREAGQNVRISCEGCVLAGLLSVPAHAWGLVVFAHGSGSGRHSPRNQQVARALQGAGLATLLPDLLTEAEEATDAASGSLRFDIALLAGRLGAVVQWTGADARLRPLPLGLFGASTGAAAALSAAAHLPARVRAVVSRGGRPDLAGAEALQRLQAPTLLIVGAEDPAVLEINREALSGIAAEHGLAVVPGASHLFEEPGALDAVGRLASAWFLQHLRPLEPTC